MTAALLGGRRAWLVWAAALSVYFLAVFHRTSLGVAGIIAADRFGVTAAQLSTFAMLQLLVYAAMQIPVGVLLDRFGPRRILLTGLALMTLAQVGFAFATSYSTGLLARTFVGIGDAMIFISVLRLVSFWFPPLRSPVITQLTGMIGQLGAIVAAVPLSAALRGFGWERTYLTAAALGVVLAVVLLAVVRDTPAGHEPARMPLRPRAVTAELRQAWSQPGTRLGLWTHFTSQFSANVMALLWGFPFLVTVHDLSPGRAGLVLSLVTASAIVVGPVIGRTVATRPFQRSTLVLGIVSAIVVMWTVVVLWPGPAPVGVLGLLAVVVGVGGPGSMVGFDLARTFNPSHRLGSAIGIVNVGGFVASLLGILGIGVVLDLLTSGSPAGYAAGDFRVAMAVQYVLWAVGGLQIWRYRRRTRKDLLHRDPQGYAAMREGRPVDAVA
ncbi:MAG: MFS transporter [Propionibacteriales bacterium]|nr:MFS transporter [Propionibacteriales bacterium]